MRVLDTMGYAFTFHVIRWMSRGRVPIGAYVHYPTISTDMLARVKERRSWHTNDESISSSTTRSTAKLLYYRIFMYAYAQALRNASFLMVNSTWTKNHVDAILSHSDAVLDSLQLVLAAINPFGIFVGLLPQVDSPKKAKVVYPPCETNELVHFPLEGRERVILSIAQFRYAGPSQIKSRTYGSPGLRRITRLNYELSTSCFLLIQSIRREERRRLS